MLQVKPWRITGFLQLAFNGLKGKVRVDRISAVADKDSKMMHLAGFSRLKHQRHARTRSPADKMMMQPCARQHRRDRNGLFSGTTVRQHKNIIPLGNSFVSTDKKIVHGLIKGVRPIRFLEKDRHAHGLEIRGIDMRHLLQLPVQKDRPRQTQTTGVGRCFRKDIALRAKIHVLGHDHFFTDGVNRRIGNLGEKLLKIIIQKLRALGKDRHRVISPH